MLLLIYWMCKKPHNSLFLSHPCLLPTHPRTNPHTHTHIYTYSRAHKRTRISSRARTHTLVLEEANKCSNHYCLCPESLNPQNALLSSIKWRQDISFYFKTIVIRYIHTLDVTLRWHIREDYKNKCCIWNAVKVLSAGFERDRYIHVESAYNGDGLSSSDALISLAALFGLLSQGALLNTVKDSTLRD